MSVLVLQELFDRKLHEASEMSTEELASELKGSVSNNNGMMSRNTMIEIVAMKLSNKELESMKWEMNLFGVSCLLECSF